MRGNRWNCCSRTVVVVSGGEKRERESKFFHWFRLFELKFIDKGMRVYDSYARRNVRENE